MSVAAPALTEIVALCIDCDDPPPLARFWQALLGGRVEVDDDGDARLVPDAPGPAIDFLRTPDRRSVKNRLHLDLGSTDFDAAVTQTLALGATRADDIYAGDRWQVFRDPEGNEFCVLRPAAVSPTGG